MVLSALLAAAMLSACSKAPVLKNTEPSVPESVPESTVPSIVNPEVTQPSATNPEVTQPSVSEPQITEPSETEPEATTPSVTEPEVTTPSVTEPEVTKPSVTNPPATEPSMPTEPKPGEEDWIYSRDELNGMDTKVNGWGLGPAKDANGRPVDAVRAQAKYGAYDAYYIMPDSDMIYLTFDEGYENGYTGKILDTLKEKNVKAVFFITMQYAKDEPELVQRMIDEGHVVGNHSVKHKSMPTLTIDRMVKEVMDLHNYVLEHFHYEMYLFRPPMGEFSQQSLAVLQNLGYKSYMWSFAYYDYDPDNQPTHEKAFDKIVGSAHGGALYLLHAVSEANTAVLGDVIDELRNHSYEFAIYE